MLNMEPGEERERLGLSVAVKSSFSFLKNLGFRLVDQKTTFVRYESPKIFVDVYHGRASYELGVEIGRISQPSDKVTLQDLVYFAGAEKAEGFGKHVMFQVSSPEGVEECMPKLARLVEKYGKPFLINDAAAYTKVFEYKLNARDRYQKDVRLRQVREKANTAWEAKNHAKVRELYNSIRPDLTEIERRRLMYAEKQLVSTRWGFLRFFSLKKR